MEETETREKRRGPCLPIEQRIQAYNEVLTLGNRGLSYSEIQLKIHERIHVQVTRNVIGKWVRGDRRPLGRVNNFDGKPSPELAYVIGSILSDGDRHIQRNGYYVLCLKVKDKEYAEVFGLAIAKVLQRKRPYEPRWGRTERRWIVRAGSILLYKELDKPWQELKPYIEHCEECVAAFLKAFFDGEGSISGRSLNVYNTNYGLLLYVQDLLCQYFSIESTGPHESEGPGHRFYDSKNGKYYETKKQCYRVHITTKDLPEFQKHIGFTIRRKAQRLAEALQNNLPPSFTP